MGAVAVAGGSSARARWGAGVVLALVTLLAATVSDGRQSITGPGDTARGTAHYGDLPLSFVPNRGQVLGAVRYRAQAPGVTADFSRGHAAFALRRGDRTLGLRLEFGGANAGSNPVAGARRSGRMNILAGPDPDRHRIALPIYGRLTYRDLWPGIDLVFRGGPGALKYELHVAPGADPSDIRFEYSGVDSLRVTGGGRLALDTAGGAIFDGRPVSHQGTAGGRRPVSTTYRLRGKTGYGFQVGPYDRRRKLVIDPALVYSTYIGGSAFEQTWDADVDRHGAAYVAGVTDSANFPITPGAYATTPNGSRDVFVTKLAPDGRSAEYSTVIGGPFGDEAEGIAVDAAGNAYVTGITNGSFPTTPGAHDRVSRGAWDVFVLKLDPTGSQLVYSTLITGSALQDARGIDVDDRGSALVVGDTSSADFPTTPGAFDRSIGRDFDAFVVKLNPAGSAIEWSTFLGGDRLDIAWDVDHGPDGGAYVVGETRGNDFPATPGAYPPTPLPGGGGGFVARLDPTGAELVYATLLPGAIRRVVADRQGNAYLTGTADDSGFPTTPGAYDRTVGGESDAFVTKLNPSGSQLIFSTVIGGSVPPPGTSSAPGEHGQGLAVDAAGDVYVAGLTGSGDFPTTSNAFDSVHATDFEDPFLTKLSADGSSLLYSTYLGGLGASDQATDVDTFAGDAFVTGYTQAAIPITPGAFDPGQELLEAFAMRLDLGPGPAARLDLEPAEARNPVDDRHCVTAAVTDEAGDPVPQVRVLFGVTGAVEVASAEPTGPDGSASFCYEGPELPGSDAITAVADTNADGDEDAGEPRGTAVKVWVFPDSTPGCSVTGGGRILTSGGDKATFGGHAEAGFEGTADGHPVYTDHGPAKLRLRRADVDAVTCAGRSAKIFGAAELKGAGDVTFRIDVTDAGAGRSDTYRMLLSNGYDSGAQHLRGGNLRVRQH